MTTETTNSLNAVNTMLSYIGESPVSTLTDSTLLEAVLASSVLNEISREVQSQGWGFNTLEDYTVYTDADKKIHLPKNTLQADTSGKDKSVEVVQRGNKLFNKKNNDFDFEQTSLNLELVLLIEFDELTEPARRFITLKAARIFNERINQVNTTHPWAKQEELKAYEILIQAESINEDYNLLENHPSSIHILQRS